MDFEWDDQKAARNLRLHKVDFNVALKVFADPERIEVLDDREDYGEERWVTIGYAGNRLLHVTHTLRDGETVRLIPHALQQRGRLMGITKISAADLRDKSRDFSIEENAYFDCLTEEQIEKAALTDPDAPPSTPDLLRKGQVDRARRIYAAKLEGLGARLVEAEPSLDLPVWELVDQNGRTVLIKALDVHKARLTPGSATKVLKLEAVQTSSSNGAPEGQGQ